MVESYLERARTLREMRRPDLAEEQVWCALAINPHHAEAHAILALVLWAREENEEAIREARRVIYCLPDWTDGHL